MEKPASFSQNLEHSSSIHATGIYYSFVKRTADLLVSVLGMLIMAIVMLVLMPFYLTGANKGPIFFKQKRVGRNGAYFYMYKFRSMVVNSETILKNNPELYKAYIANSFKLPEGQDPRVTKLGHFLRKTSLDELPQFINIFRGEMSLIGPRPVVAKELSEYGDNVSELLAAKPGAMGLWQASGRSEICYPERADLELYYVRHRSIWFDIQIFFKNIIAIFKAKGAF